MKKIVIGLSGGMDSATLLGYYFNKGYDVHPLSFDYGSKHNKYERQAALDLVQYYGCNKIKDISLPFINNLFKSNLLQSGGDIPEGHYQAENMSLTVVPGRNIIFLSIMAGYAWSIGAELIAYGAHSGDHAIYEDCRPWFIECMGKAILEGTGERVKVEAPFTDLDKSKILQIGYSLPNPVPYELTRTCYKDQQKSCGKCGSCQERLEAFSIIGKTDPIIYEAL